jgi:hypothetical protein
MHLERQKYTLISLYIEQRATKGLGYVHICFILEQVVTELPRCHCDLIFAMHPYLDCSITVETLFDKGLNA